MMFDRMGYIEEEEAEEFLVQEAENENRSMVRVRFPGRGMPLMYYNDLFDLHPGDIVYVDGKLAGVRGVVTEVNRNFKIRAGDYQRVICLVDTRVNGRFELLGSYFLTFDRAVLPYEKVHPWFRGPSQEEFITGDDGSGFPLDELEEMEISPVIAQRGLQYFDDGHVVYLAMDRHLGRAIVQGTEAYEVEFDLTDGWVSRLFCTCPCGFHCKHEYAALLALREMLGNLDEDFPACHDYFAAVDHTALLSNSRRKRGTLFLSDYEEAYPGQF